MWYRLRAEGIRGRDGRRQTTQKELRQTCHQESHVRTKQAGRPAICRGQQGIHYVTKQAAPRVFTRQRGG